MAKLFLTHSKGKIEKNLLKKIRLRNIICTSVTFKNQVYDRCKTSVRFKTSPTLVLQIHATIHRKLFFKNLERRKNEHWRIGVFLNGFWLPTVCTPEEKLAIVGPINTVI